MRNNILIYILTIAFVIMFSGVSAQQEKYEEIRKISSEITDWNNLEGFFKTKSIDSVQTKLDSLSQSYMSHGKWEIYLYINNQVAQYLFRRGFYIEGREIAINAGNKVKHHIDTCNLEYIYGLQLMAESYYNSKLRQHKQALPYLHRAEKLLQRIDIPSMEACNDYYIGSSYVETGDLEKGVKYLFKAKDQALEQNDIALVASCFLDLASSVPDEQNDLGIDFNLHGIEVLEKHNQVTLNYKIMHTNVASKYLENEDYTNALKYVSKAEQLYEGDSLYYEALMISVCANKGIALYNLGDFEQAGIYLNKLMELIKKVYGENSPVMSNGYFELGRYMSHMEDYDSSLYYYQKALKLNEEVIGGFSPFNYSFYNEIGNICFDYKNDLEGALRNYQMALYQAVDCNRDTNDFIRLPQINQIYDRNYTFDALYQKVKCLKEIYLKNPDPAYLKSALKHSLVCDSIGKLIQKNAILDETGLSFSSKYQKLSSLTIYICTKLNLLFPEACYDKDAFYFSALPKSNYLSYQVNQKDKEINIDTLEMKQFQLSEAIRNLENQLQSFAISNSPKDFAILKEELYNKRVEAYLLSFKIEKRKILMDSYPVDVMQESIPDNKALVNYNIADSVLYTLLMDNNKILIKQTKISKEFYSNISGLYRSIKTGNSDFGNYAKYLSDILIKPIINDLKAKTELVIIPDGDLFRIPFDLLPVSNPDTQSYLIEKFAISYNYSPFLWYKSNEKSLKNKDCEENLLAMAPVFSKDEDAIISDDNPFRSDSLLIRDGISNRMGKSLSELPYSYKEVKSIERLFDKQDKKSKVLCFAEACEESFKKYAGEYKYIHLATHGFSSRNNADLSGLFFSQKENSQIDKDFTNDGFLYSGEMYCLENSADLVVLSACKTGTGKIAQGEGVLGIPRGFIYAGVPNIMVSLWKIHDKNTKDLMVDFYEHLLAGDGYASALQKAKLVQIRKGALPLDWSGIVLIGK